MNYTITKQGRYGIIFPIPTGKLCNMLSKKMSYVKQGAEFMPHPEWGIIKLYNPVKGRFPWGFKKLVVSIMKEWKIYSHDDFIIDYSLNFPEHGVTWYDKELREYQLDAINELYKNDGGILCLPTGAGKTRIAIEYIKQKNCNTLVVVHTLDLLNQWAKQTNLLPNVKIATYQSLKSLSDLAKYNLVIFDECHHVASKSLYKIAMNCPNAQLIGLSASPKREDGEDMKIEAALGTIVYSITRKELINKGYLVNAKVYYHSLEPAENNYWISYHDAYESYIVNNHERNDKIIHTINNNCDRNKKILVLFSQINHLELIKERLKSINKEALVIHGQLSKKERIKLTEEVNKATSSIIVLASTIFDEGVDFPALDTIILAAGGKSSIKLTQRVGRILRPSANKQMAVIYDFADDCKWLSSHYKKRKYILEQDFEVDYV